MGGGRVFKGSRGGLEEEAATAANDMVAAEASGEGEADECGTTEEEKGESAVEEGGCGRGIEGGCKNGRRNGGRGRRPSCKRNETQKGRRRAPWEGVQVSPGVAGEPGTTEEERQLMGGTARGHECTLGETLAAGTLLSA